MIDGNGTLKFSDFGLSKLEGEDLETIFQETFDSTSSQWSQSASTNSPPKSYKKPFGDLKYMAPEVISGEDNSKESDIWSLGVLLYQMYTGSMPFVSENPEQLKQMILNKNFSLVILQKAEIRLNPSRCSGAFNFCEMIELRHFEKIVLPPSFLMTSMLFLYNQAYFSHKSTKKANL